MADIKKIKPNAIKVILPEVQQKTHFSCGAAVVHSVCAYWGLGLDSHYDYFPYLETDEAYGTLPDKIVNYLKQVGLNCDMRYNMTIRDLCLELDKGRPVIVAVQAWGNTKMYNKFGNGHYLVAIGYDKQSIFFEDPWLNCTRGYISKKDFLKRWHDMDFKSKIHERMGISVWHRKRPFYNFTAKKIK